MKKSLSTLAFTLAAVLSAPVLAEAQDENTELADRFTRLTNMQVVAIEDAPIEGMTQIVTKSGVLYVSEDGEHILSGALHEFQQGFKNLSKERIAEIYKPEIDRLKNTFIQYKAPDEKHEVIVFYDSNCSYCKQLHRNIDTYLAKGITINYAAAPMFGPSSVSGLNSIWCSEDPKAALNDNAHGTKPSGPSCAESPVAEHKALADMLGVRATPMIYSTNGTLVKQGAAPAKSLMEALEQ